MEDEEDQVEFDDFEFDLGFNVLAGVQEAKKRGLMTVCLAGYGGGRIAELCDRSHVVDADYIPRIQEAQASAYHVLRELIELGGEDR